MWSKCSQLYQNVGIDISVKKDSKEDEYDLQMVYVDGDTLNWILVEVKNKNFHPWDSTKFQAKLQFMVWAPWAPWAPYGAGLLGLWAPEGDVPSVLSMVLGSQGCWAPEFAGLPS